MTDLINTIDAALETKCEAQPTTSVDHIAEAIEAELNEATEIPEGEFYTSDSPETQIPGGMSFAIYLVNGILNGTEAYDLFLDKVTSLLQESKMDTAIAPAQLVAKIKTRRWDNCQMATETLLTCLTLIG
ncbi:MAG: hypothetical protein F6J98_02110 [Moorea sp. SIO4G2]|nr:hypothetical protein [Moorena sp. SIO4G2]